MYIIDFYDECVIIKSLIIYSIQQIISDFLGITNYKYVYNEGSVFNYV